MEEVFYNRVCQALITCACTGYKKYDTSTAFWIDSKRVLNDERDSGCAAFMDEFTSDKNHHKNRRSVDYDAQLCIILFLKIANTLRGS